MFKQKNTLAKVIFCTLVLSSSVANAALVFTFEAAGVQTTNVPAGEYKVETFDNGTAGSTIGSFSGTYQIKPATLWGGAGGNTKYAFCSNSNPLYLSLTQPVGYFGFWWSAGDGGNILEVTTADGVVHRYTTQSLFDSKLLTPAHYGNPNPAFLGQNKPQPYVFLNFFATDDKSKIKLVKLSGSNFEADNYTAAANLQKITGKVVGGTCPTLQAVSATPPDYALSDNGKKVTICHNTSSVTNPFTINTIDITALSTHLSNHGDYFTMSGICPTDSVPCPSCPTGQDLVNGVCSTTSASPTVTLGQTATTTTAPTITGTVGTSASLTIQVLLNGAVKTTGLAIISGSGTTKTWSFTLSSALAAGTYEIVATGDAAGGSLTDAQNNELVVSTATTNTPTVDDVSSDNTFDTESVRGSHPWIAKAIEDTTPTITGTVGGQVLNNDSFAVTISKSADTSGAAYTHTYTKGSDAALTVANGSTNWSLAIPTGLAAGVYEVNAVRTATADLTHGELIIGIPYCNNGADGYILRPNFDGTKDAATYYLGTCGSAVTKTNPTPYLDTLQPQKLVGTGVCTDAEGGGARNTQPISTATIKRATIINATTLGGTTTKNLADTVVKYGERSGGTMDISNAEIMGGVATNVTITGATLNNLYLDIEGSFDTVTGVFSPSDTYIGVKDGTTGVTKPSGDGAAIPKAQITDGVITSGTAADTPIRGRLLAGFYDTNTSSTTMTTTKGRRTFGTLTGATITGATTTTAKMTDGSIKTVVESGEITSGSFAITSTFGTATNAKIENANITDVNSCFSSSEVNSRGQLNWKEVISE